MADAQKVVDLIFNGVDKTGAATASALKNAQGFSDAVGAGVKPLADFTLGALKLEAALLTAGAAVSLFSVKVAGDFDSAFREISTLISQPVDELGEFRDAILSYASSSTQPLEQVTQAIYNAISAGIDFEDSIAAVAQAEKLAVAGKADLNASLVVLVSSLNAYGLGMDSAERFSDALFETVKQGQTTMPELASSLAMVTGTAATLQVPFETVLAAIATLTAQGTPTTQAVTQINAALAALIKPTSQASEVAAELGIEFNAQAVKAKGLEVVLAEVAKATGGNEEQMGKLFGSVEALRAVFPLTGAAADSFSDKLGSLRNSTGATEEAFARMAGAVSQSNQQIKNALQQVFISIGDPLLDEYGGIAEAVAGIFNAIGLSVKQGELGTIVQYVESLFGDVQVTLERMAKNLPAALESADLSGFQRGVEAIVNAIKDLFGGIDLGSPEGLIRAIELAGNAFLALSQYSAGAISALKPLFDLFIQGAEWVSNIDSDIIKLVGTIGGLAVGIDLLLPAFNTLLLGMIALQGVGGAGGAVAAVAALGKTIGGLGAAAAVGYGAGTLLAAGIDKTITAVSGSEQSLGTWIYELVNGKREAELLAVALGKTGDQTEGFAKKVDDIAESTFELVDLNAEWNASLLKTGGVIDAASDTLDGFWRATQYTAEQLRDMREQSSLGTAVYDAMTGEFLRYERIVKTAGAATKETGTEISKSAEEMRKAEGATRAFNLEMEKLASAERIASIQAQTSLLTSRMETDAERIKAAFESANVAIESTGEVILGLFNTLATGDLSFSQEFQLEKELRKESERRDESLKLQQELTRAQIEEMKARTQAMIKGDGLIKIEGDGLQPHLEAFMWEILKAIQVRVNSDGLDMLLGVQSA